MTGAPTQAEVRPGAATLADVRDYHRQSKHGFQAYARGPGTIDWERQPDPFRRFDESPVRELPLTPRERDAPSPWFAGVDIDALSQPGALPRVAISAQALGAWLEHSLALSAWKQHGAARWSVRCNPSSGNLHPTEAYPVLLGVAGFRDGVYHYRADLHALELRCAFTTQDAQPGVYIGLSSLQWREAWKYGERAYRYCQLDIGHAVAALAYGAALNGWSLAQVPLRDAELEALLGTGRAADFVTGEGERGDCLLQVCTGAANAAGADKLLQRARDGEWFGSARTIDSRHFYEWPVLDSIASLVRRESRIADAPVEVEAHAELPSPLPASGGEMLANLARRRRSAQAFDPAAQMGREAFFALLDHLLPRPAIAPWNALPRETSLHCVLFLHRVEGIDPGLYALPRSPRGEELMRRELREEFAWAGIEGAPAHLPLYRLVSARAERAAARLSCQQAIAGDGVFSLAMLADFAASIEDRAWRYRELYWEAGAIGQALYIEAENAGLSGTGIGCFFDDPVHELLGIGGDALQSLYHFTVGRPLRDNRIVSLPPYGQRRGEQDAIA